MCVYYSVLLHLIDRHICTIYSVYITLINHSSLGAYTMDTAFSNCLAVFSFALKESHKSNNFPCTCTCGVGTSAKKRPKRRYITFTPRYANPYFEIFTNQI